MFCCFAIKALIEQLQESRDAAQRQRENHARTKQELDAKCASLEESVRSEF